MRSPTLALLRVLVEIVLLPARLALGLLGAVMILFGGLGVVAWAIQLLLGGPGVGSIPLP